MPFTFAPVALDVYFSLGFHRLRFLTFGLFLWCGFFGVGKCLAKTAFLWRCCQSLKTESFAKLKTVKKGSLARFSSSQLSS